MPLWFIKEVYDEKRKKQWVTAHKDNSTYAYILFIKGRHMSIAYLAEKLFPNLR